MKIQRIVLLFLFAISGCASFVQGDKQLLRVESKCGQRSVPSVCTVHNSQGVWRLNAPGSVIIKRDLYPLQVSCVAPFFGTQEAIIPSSLHALTVGNVLIGGAVGAGWDLYSGSAMAYPGTVLLQFSGC